MSNIASGLIKQARGLADQMVDTNFTPTTVATPEQANQQYANINTGLTQQQQFLNALAAQNGIQNQADVYNQLNQMAQGQGPNPAQMMLNNATGVNVANQAALMAGQRGAAANPALIARQAAMQGSNAQQQAAGQAAALQAQQQANAINSMGNLATQQVGQQANATNAYTNAAQNAYQGVTGNINDVNRINAGIAGQEAEARSKIIGNVMGGAGKAATMMAEGGQVPSGPMSAAGRFLHAYAQGGKVDALVSPGEKYLTPEQVAQVQQGANPMAIGETIPGKPKVDGAKNSYANDTVPKKLETGGVVLPRSVTKAENPDQKARDFVAAVLRKKV